MKKALICPNEPIESGYRIADVVDVEFPVANPLYWISCDDDLLADTYWFDPIDNQIKIKSFQGTPEQPVVTGAQSL